MEWKFNVTKGNYLFHTMQKRIFFEITLLLIGITAQGKKTKPMLFADGTPISTWFSDSIYIQCGTIVCK